MTDTPPPTTITITSTPTATATPIVFPIPETPVAPDTDKPSLVFSAVQASMEPKLGYAAPIEIGGPTTLLLRAASFVDIAPDGSQRFTPVGMAEVGANLETGTESVVYLVTIDLHSKADVVDAQLLALDGTSVFDVRFQRIPLKLNPARIHSPFQEFQQLPPPSDSGATIFSNGACFLVRRDRGKGSSTGIGASEGSGDTGIDSITADSTSGLGNYVKFCPNPNEPSPLSIRRNFPSQYAQLQDMILGVAEQFHLQDVIQLDRVISTRESIQGLQECAREVSAQTCAADIVLAPVKQQYFDRQFRKRFGGNGGGDGDDRDDRDDRDQKPGSFVFTSLLQPLLQQSGPAQFVVAAVKVLQPIETSLGIVPTGDYELLYTFDEKGNFVAASLTGMTTDHTPVTNLQIPAEPATFVEKNENGPQQPDAQISACYVLGHCVFEKKCN
jgi:hypothetical protein